MYNFPPDKGPYGSTLRPFYLLLRIALFILFKDVICFSFPFEGAETVLHSAVNLFINQKQTPSVNHF